MEDNKVLFNLIASLTILLLIAGSIHHSKQTHADSNESEPGIISTSPDSILFNVENMKPGDCAERTLTIQNRGEADFTYNTEALFSGGSKKLYRIFLLEVEDAHGMVFEGKLADFEGLEPRVLQASHEEELLFTVKFPPEAGNEYQGLQFETEFKFTADVQGGDASPPEEPANDGESVGAVTVGRDLTPQQPIPERDYTEGIKQGQILPSTSTNMFNYMLIGILLLLTGVALRIYYHRKLSAKAHY